MWESRFFISIFEEFFEVFRVVMKGLMCWEKDMKLLGEVEPRWKISFLFSPSLVGMRGIFLKRYLK